MSSIIWRGDTYHGISVFGRGVFKDAHGWTYAGHIRDGRACGLGVATHSSGSKDYAEHGPDGQFDGRYLYRSADGVTGYYLYERGRTTANAFVYADSRCVYNGEDCAPDDPRLLALIALVAPVEVRPAAPAPHPPLARHSPASNRPMDRPARFAPAGAGDRRCHRGSSPRRTVCRGCATQPNSSRTAKRDDAMTRARAVVVAREAPSCTLTTTVCTPMGPSSSVVAMPSSSKPRYRITGIRGALSVLVHVLHAARS
jgi:hypothetical protein